MRYAMIRSQTVKIRAGQIVTKSTILWEMGRQTNQP